MGYTTSMVLVSSVVVVIGGPHGGWWRWRGGVVEWERWWAVCDEELQKTVMCVCNAFSPTFDQKFSYL
jgi:hypothetical protein